MQKREKKILIVSNNTIYDLYNIYWKLDLLYCVEIMYFFLHIDSNTYIMTVITVK